MPADLRVTTTPWSDPQAVALRREMHDYLATIYPAETAGGFEALDARVSRGIVATAVAWLDGVATGCASLRLLPTDPVAGEPTVGELKKVFVRPGSRGAGVGRALLEHIEAVAGELGITRLVLETGAVQDPAIRLYLAAGYRRIDALPRYRDDPTSLCFAKDLARPTGADGLHPRG